MNDKPFAVIKVGLSTTLIASRRFFATTVRMPNLGTPMLLLKSNLTLEDQVLPPAAAT
jgi:hypothetical protein